MIVRDHRNAPTEVVLQSSHAWFAAQLLQLWTPDRTSLEWSELLNATAQHDHGWIPYDPLGKLRNGRPLNFVDIDLDDVVQICERTVNNGFSQSIRCGILATCHMEFLYAKKDHAGLQEASKGWKKRREEAMEQAGLDQTWVESSYEYLLWADTVSLLTICLPSPFTDLLTARLGDTSFQFQQVTEEHVTLHPWPFEQDEYTFRFEALRLSKKSYESERQLAKDLISAPWVPHTILLTGA